MICSEGVCTPTAAKATLNVTDLANMLSASDVKVVADANAQDIQIKAALNWTSASRLTLDAYRSISFEQELSIAGPGGLTLTTNDGGSDGELWFGIGGKASLWDVAVSSLVINGADYTLLGNIVDLAKAVKNNPLGHYGFAHDYDASADGTYYQSPVVTTFDGTFEGLGHTISNLTINDPKNKHQALGLFRVTDLHSTIRDFGLINTHVTGDAASGSGTVVDSNDGTIINVYAKDSVITPRYGGSTATAGGLVSANSGTIVRSWASGSIDAWSTFMAGGLVAQNLGSIRQSHADVSITNAGMHGNGCGGGLVGWHRSSTIEQSFATGKVSGLNCLGGLVGNADGETTDSYATGAVSGTGTNIGGLAGYADRAISTSYATGIVREGSGASIGGFIGFDDSSFLSSNYWDLDRSGISDPGQGAGNVPNDPGITGLTDDELKSSLPAGFDPNVWGQSSKVNNGYPYLLVNRPQ